MSPYAIARVCHEANRQYCLELGDHTQVAWAAAPEWQKESALNGVLFHQQHPGRGPESSHENWLKEKEATGWIYGPKKDALRKEHPCLVPFHQLAVSQQLKDVLFVSIVRALS